MKEHNLVGNGAYMKSTVYSINARFRIANENKLMEQRFNTLVPLGAIALIMLLMALLS